MPAPSSLSHRVFDHLDDIYIEGHYASTIGPNLEQEIATKRDALKRLLGSLLPNKPIDLNMGKVLAKQLTTVVWLQGNLDSKGSGDSPPTPPSSNDLFKVLKEAFEAGQAASEGGDISKPLLVILEDIKDFGRTGTTTMGSYIGSSINERMHRPLTMLFFNSGSLSGSRLASFRQQLRTFGSLP